MRKYRAGDWIFYVNYENKILEERIAWDDSFYHLQNDDYIYHDSAILASRVDGKIIMNDEYIVGIERRVMSASLDRELFDNLKNGTVETFKWSAAEQKMVVSNK